MKDFLKIMEKDITEDRFSMSEAYFYAGVILVLGASVILFTTALNWLVTY